MVLQGGPEMPKWPPRVLPRCQNGSQNVKMETPSTPNGNPEEPKGPAAEGVALKISNDCREIIHGQSSTDPGQSTDIPWKIPWMIPGGAWEILTFTL